MRPRPTAAQRPRACSRRLPRHRRSSRPTGTRRPSTASCTRWSATATSIDKAKATVTGPLDRPTGDDTGVKIEIRSGGPAIGFQTVTSHVRQRRHPVSATSTPTRRSRTRPTFPTVAIESGLREEPADDHVGSDDLSRRRPSPISARKASRSATSVAPPTWTTSRRAGVLETGQVDGSYNGTPALFIADEGKSAQQGFGSAEPYLYENEIDGLEEAGRVRVHQRRRLEELRRVDRDQAGEHHQVRRLLQAARPDHPAGQRRLRERARPRPTRSSSTLSTRSAPTSVGATPRVQPTTASPPSRLTASWPTAPMASSATSTSTV